MKPPNATVMDRLQKIIMGFDKVQAHCAAVGIVRETPIIGRGLGFDSVAIFHLVEDMENEFGIRVDPSELSMNTFENVGTLADFISGKLQQYH